MFIVITANMLPRGTKSVSREHTLSTDQLAGGAGEGGNSQEIANTSNNSIDHGTDGVYR